MVVLFFVYIDKKGIMLEFKFNWKSVIWTLGVLLVACTYKLPMLFLEYNHNFINNGLYQGVKAEGFLVQLNKEPDRTFLLSPLELFVNYEPIYIYIFVYLSSLGASLRVLSPKCYRLITPMLLWRSASILYIYVSSIGLSWKRKGSKCHWTKKHIEPFRIHATCVL